MLRMRAIALCAHNHYDPPTLRLPFSVLSPDAWPCAKIKFLFIFYIYIDSTPIQKKAIYHFVKYVRPY